MIFEIQAKFVILLVNLEQFNQGNWEFVNFPNFCGDAPTFVIQKILFEILHQLKPYIKKIEENMFLAVFIS